MYKSIVNASRYLIFAIGLLSALASHSAATSSEDFIDQPGHEITCDGDLDCKSNNKQKINITPPTNAQAVDPKTKAKLQIEQNTLQKTVESTIATDKEKLEIVKERLDEMEKRHMENIDHIVSQFDDQFNTEFDTLTLDNQFVKDIDATLKSSPNQPQILNDFKGSGLYIAGYPIEAVAAVVLPPLLYILWYLTRRMLGKS